MPKNAEPVFHPVPAPALKFGISCPRCGSDVEMVAPGAPGLNVTQAIVRCTGCASHPSWLVRVTLEAISYARPGREAA